MSDSNDVVLAQAGDYDAFERLYRSYFGRIYSLCARLSGSDDSARELTQEVFVKAWERLADFDGETPFALWLCRLAIELEVVRERPARESIPALLSDALELPQALAVLDPAARGIFVLHDVEGYQHQEIAQIFGISVGASKARLQQARVLLMKALGR